jgi:hypothetical protein
MGVAVGIGNRRPGKRCPYEECVHQANRAQRVVFAFREAFTSRGDRSFASPAARNLGQVRFRPYAGIGD